MLKRGIFISRVTSDEDLRKFFEMVRPIATKKDLIRIGGSGDGGYLLPDDLDDIEACFSPGVAETTTFEEDLARGGIKSFLVDYSVEAPPVKNKFFSFERKFLRDTNDGKYIRLEDWVQNNTVSEENDLLLQMDIEGVEFSVILDTPLSLFRRFRIMVIEFHSMDMIFSKQAFPFINQVFKKLTKDFTVVHIHPNNCYPVVSRGDFDVPVFIELTFYRKDRVENSERELVFPHALDVSNVKDNEDIILPECWR